MVMVLDENTKNFSNIFHSISYIHIFLYNLENDIQFLIQLRRRSLGLQCGAENTPNCPNIVCVSGIFRQKFVQLSQ